MEFKQVNQEYVDDAVKLAMAEYESECERCSQLIHGDFKEKLADLISGLFDSKYGIAAFDEGKLRGYLSFWEPWDGFFGNEKGVFCPLGGSAFAGNDRSKLASLLFEKAANILVEDGITSVAVSRYAHDDEIQKSFVLNGFGIRCSDAIRDLSSTFNKKREAAGVEFLELKKDQYASIRSLKMTLVKHLSVGPVFFPSNLSTIEQWLTNNSNIRTFIAKVDDDIIGYIEFSDSGETFLTESKRMRSICGTFFKKEYRGSSIAENLLNYICEVLKDEGIEYLGVDCETINPTALRFWGKYFENYTYSLHRRIDERIVGYGKALENI